jgi:hypothetical protein
VKKIEKSADPSTFDQVYQPNEGSEEKRLLIKCVLETRSLGIATEKTGSKKRSSFLAAPSVPPPLFIQIMKKKIAGRTCNFCDVLLRCDSIFHGEMQTWTPVRPCKG